MPTVPRVTRQVQLQGIAGTKLTAAESAESLGARPNDPIAAALVGVGSQTAQVGGELYRDMIEKERKRADEVAILNASSQLAGWENKRIYDPTNGALTVKGQAAFGLPESINAEYNEQADNIAAGLATDRQRSAFARIRAERGIDLDGTLRKHTYAEIQQYQGQELQAFLDNSRSAAVANATDPRRVGMELQRQVDAIKTHAPALGLGPEALQKQIDAVRSATHVGVVEELLAQEQTKTAQIYFDEARSQINGEQIARLERSLAEGTLRKQAQTKADEILGSTGTMREALDKAKGIEDAKERDAVTERIEHRWSINDKLKRDDEEGASTAAFNILDKNRGDISKIPPTTWESFAGPTKASLRAYGKRLAAGENIDTDWTTFYSLIDQAGTKPGDFAKANILNYRGKLANAEFKQVADLQLSIRNRDAKGDQPLAEFGTEQQIVNDSLIQYGFETEPSKQSSDEKYAVAELRRRVREQVGLLKKKEVTQKDIQSITDNILSQKATVKGSWWGLVPFNGISLRDQSRPIINLRITDIPDAEKEQIKAALRQSNRPVSDATILDLYMRAKGRGTAQGE